MRVLYLLNSVGGGASAGIFEMLRNQQAIQAYAVAPPGSTKQIHELFEDIQTIPLSWWNIPVEAGFARRTAFSFGRWRRGITHQTGAAAIKQLIRKWQIDVVHTGTSLTVEGALSAHDLNIPHIWHIKETVGSPNRVQFPLPDPELIAFFSRMSSYVITMSEYIGRIFRSYNCPNLRVIPDGVDFEPYQNQSQNLRAQLRIKSGEYLVGMVAGLGSIWKRHELFIQMASLLAQQNSQIHFAIIGGSPSMSSRWPHDLSKRYAERIFVLAKNHLPEGRLTFVDHIADSSDIMRSLDILVHPCEIEPFGRIAIEAMAAGIPVVGPCLGGIAETVMPDKTGILVRPNDPEALGQAVNQLLNNDILRHEMGIAGREHAQANFGIQHHREELLKVYETALAKVTSFHA